MNADLAQEFNRYNLTKCNVGFQPNCFHGFAVRAQFFSQTSCLLYFQIFAYAVCKAGCSKKNSLEIDKPCKFKQSK